MKEIYTCVRSGAKGGGKLLFLLLFLTVVGKAWGQATLPTSFTGPSWQSGLPTGWSQTGFGADYAATYDASGAAGKMDDAGDKLIIFFSGTPSNLSYYLGGNSLSGSYQFDVQESVDGISYTTIRSHTSGTNTIVTSPGSSWSIGLNTTSRYVRFIYTTKSGGNVGIDGVTITAQTAPPTKLAITNINPATPSAGSGFSITVQSQDGTGTAQNVTASTDFTLTTNGNAGTIGGTVSGTIPAGSSSVVVSGITLSTSGTNATLTATRTSGDNLTTGTSANFNVGMASSASDYFQSKVAGSWATASNWETSPDNGASIPFTTSTLVPDANAKGITIKNGYNITSNAAVNADDITVENGATLTITAGTFTVANGTAAIDLKSNGTVTVTGGSITAAASAVIDFSSTGIYNHAMNGGTIPTATWNATSTCNVTGMTNTVPGNYAQAYGNFTWNCSQTGSNYINIDNSAFSVAETLTVGPLSGNLFSFGNVAGTKTNSVKNLTVTGGVFNVVGSTAVINLNITNDFTLSGGVATVEYSTGTGNLTISNDLLISGGSFVVINNDASPAATVNVGRDLKISATGKINLKSPSANTAASVISVTRDFISTGTNVASSGANGIVDFGDGTISANGIFIGRNFNKSGAGTFGSKTLAATPALGFVFTGGTTATPATLSYSGATSNYTSYTVATGAVVQLQTDLTLGSSVSDPVSVFTIAGTGIVDFQAKSIIGNSRAEFTTASGCGFITSNAAGIGGTTATGSLQSFNSTNATGTVAGRATLVAGVKYTFNGATTAPFPLTTFGNPGSITTNAAVVSNMVSGLTVSGTFNINNSSSFTLNSTNNNSLALGGVMTIASTGTFNNGGSNQITDGGTPSIIVNGTFVSQHASGLYGSGTAIPSVPITFNTGSTAEYGGAGQTFQSFSATQVTGLPTNIIFSGTGTKTGGSISTADPGLITIKANVTVDATGGASFGGSNTDLTMEAGSKLRVEGSATQPKMTGTYTLAAGSTIDFAGASTCDIRQKNYQNIEFSGTGTKNSPATLNVLGNFTKSGTGSFNNNSGTVSFNGTTSSTQTYSCSGTAVDFYNLKINNSGSGGVTVAGDMGIQSKLTFPVSTAKLLLSTGNIHLRSTATRTAGVGAVPLSGTGTIDYPGAGRFYVEKYIATPRKWQFLSPEATTGTTAAGTAATFLNTWMENQTVPTGYGMWVTGETGTPNFDGITTTPTIKWWDGTVYTGITSKSDNIHAYNAYMTYVRGDRNITGSGGTATATILRTSGKLNVGAYPTTAPGYTVVGTLNSTVAFGNPYASAIDLRNIGMDQSLPPTTIITIYVWDPKLTTGSVYGLGAFQTLTGTQQDGFQVSPGGGSYGAQNSYMNTIESGQAFFVQGATSDLHVSFSEAAKADYVQTVSFVQGQAETIGARLYLKGNPENALMDGFMVKFGNGYNNLVDNSDARKMVNTSENVSVKKGHSLLAVEYRKPVDEFDTVRINMAGLHMSDYVWSFDMTNMDAPGRIAYLIDRFTGTKTSLDISGSNTYPFTATSSAAGSYAADRFMIVFRQGAIAGPLPVKFTSISAARQKEKVEVRFNTENEINMDHYTVERSANGVSFSPMMSNGQQANVAPANNAGGHAVYTQVDTDPLNMDNYYRIRGVSNNGQVQYSAIAKVGPLTQTAAISISPNPVEGETMNILFANPPAGKYTLKITDMNGRVLLTKTITVVAGNSIATIALPGNTAAGSYMATLMDEAGRSTTISFIIK